MYGKQTGKVEFSDEDALKLYGVWFAMSYAVLLEFFLEHTELEIMEMLASQALLRENKKNIQQQNVISLIIELRTSAIWI